MSPAMSLRPGGLTPGIHPKPILGSRNARHAPEPLELKLSPSGDKAGPLPPWNFPSHGTLGETKMPELSLGLAG